MLGNRPVRFGKGAAGRLISYLAGACPIGKRVTKKGPAKEALRPRQYPFIRDCDGEK